MMRRMILFALVLSFAGCGVDRRNTIVVGSKNFTEQAILGEIVAQHLEARTKLNVVRRFYLAGSYICQQALLTGHIDTYVEYTGTALTAILKDPVQSDRAAVLDRVRREYASRFNLVVTEPLGFNNTFAIVIRGEDARRAGNSHSFGSGSLLPAMASGIRLRIHGAAGRLSGAGANLRPEIRGVAAHYGFGPFVSCAAG